MLQKLFLIFIKKQESVSPLQCTFLVLQESCLHNVSTTLFLNLFHCRQWQSTLGSSHQQST